MLLTNNYQHMSRQQQDHMNWPELRSLIRLNWMHNHILLQLRFLVLRRFVRRVLLPLLLEKSLQMFL